MINLIEKYLKENEPKSIELMDLSVAVGLSYETVLEIIENKKRLDCSELEHYYMKAGTNKLINRYPTDLKTKHNIELTLLLEGHKIHKGLIDNSECGGLYHSAFTKFDRFGKEMTKFDELNLEELLNYLPEVKFVIEKSDNYTIKLKNHNIEINSACFFYGFAEAVKALSQKNDLFVVHVREIYEEDLNETDYEQPDPFTQSPCFLTKESAENWILLMKKDEYRSERIYFEIVKTNIL